MNWILVQIFTIRYNDLFQFWGIVGITKSSNKCVCCPQTKRWSLLGMRYMRMRKISWRLKSWNYPCWKHSDSSLAHCTIREILYVISLYTVAEQCCSYQKQPSSPPIVSTPPHRVRTPPLMGIITWSVVCATCCNIQECRFLLQNVFMCFTWCSQ